MVAPTHRLLAAARPASYMGFCLSRAGPLSPALCKWRRGRPCPYLSPCKKGQQSRVCHRRCLPTKYFPGQSLWDRAKFTLWLAPYSRQPRMCSHTNLWCAPSFASVSKLAASTLEWVAIRVSCTSPLSPMKSSTESAGRRGTGHFDVAGLSIGTEPNGNRHPPNAVVTPTAFDLGRNRWYPEQTPKR